MSSEVKDKWDIIAEPWVEEWREVEPWQVEEREDFAKLCVNGLILGLGCASGRDLRIFSKLGLTCIGLDFSSKMLSLADRGDTVIQADIEYIPFKSEVFDAVWSCSVLKYLSIEGVLKCLQDAYRVLKREGYFWLSVEYGEGVKMESRYGVEMSTLLFTEDSLLKLVEKAGFKLIDIKIIEKWRKFIILLLQK